VARIGRRERARKAEKRVAQPLERRCILVRELGLALRIGTEGGTFSETDQVRTTRVGQATRYEGTIPVEGHPTPVTMDVVTEDGLLPC
jgi:hypothetical protein